MHEIHEIPALIASYKPKKQRLLMYVPALKLVREAYLYITIKSLISQSCNRLRMRILIPDWREGDSFSERRKAATGSFSHFPPNPLAQRNKKNQQMLVLFIWRREGDSNPRYGCPYAAFRVRCIRPLCHLSAEGPACAVPVERRPLANDDRLAKRPAPYFSCNTHQAP